MVILKLLYLFAFIWSYKLLINLYYHNKTVVLERAYRKFWKEKDTHIKDRHIEIRELLERAGVKDGLVTEMQPIGYGHAEYVKSSVYDNMFYNNVDVLSTMERAFRIAKGVYKRRIKESFNPVYWIECVVYLPKNIFEYLGLNSDTKETKIFQLLYWFGSAFFFIYNEQIVKLIQDFLSSLFK